MHTYIGEAYNYEGYIDYVFLQDIDSYFGNDKLVKHFGTSPRLCNTTEESEALVTNIVKFIRLRDSEDFQIDSIDLEVIYTKDGLVDSMSYSAFFEYIESLMSVYPTSDKFESGALVMFYSENTLRRRKGNAIQQVKKHNLMNLVLTVHEDKGESNVVIFGKDTQSTVRLVTNSGKHYIVGDDLIKTADLERVREEKKKKDIQIIAKKLEEEATSEKEEEIVLRRDRSLKEFIRAERALYQLHHKDYLGEAKKLYEIYNNDFDSISNHILVKEFKRDDSSISKGTIVIDLHKGIPMKDYRDREWGYKSGCGYRITINFSTKSREKLIKFSTWDEERRGNYHPHIGSSGSHCRGALATPLSNALKEHDVSMCFEIALQFLMEYNSNSVLTDIDECIDSGILEPIDEETKEKYPIYFQ